MSRRSHIGSRCGTPKFGDATLANCVVSIDLRPLCKLDPFANRFGILTRTGARTKARSYAIGLALAASGMSDLHEARDPEREPQIAASSLIGIGAMLRRLIGTLGAHREGIDDS